MQLVETAPHEFNANFNFDAGLGPFFAADRQIKKGGGSVKGRFEAFGESWDVKLYYQDSNVLPPDDGTTPAGTPWRLDEPREFRFKVEAVEADDQAGQKSFNAHLRPRWDRMKIEDSRGRTSRPNVPFEEGVNLKVQGSNIEFVRYLELVQKAAEAVGVNASHFDERGRHESSVVTQAERYVRVHEDYSGPIHARDGPLARAGHLLEDDRNGRREIEQTDIDESGEKVPGYRHQVGLDERRVREVWPNHELPKRFKHYRARESKSLDGALRHPKVGAIYYGSLWRDRSRNHGVTRDELDQLTHELEESLLSMLADAGLDVSSAHQYVSDDYFEADTSDRDRQIVELPLEELQTNQESVVINHVADGLSPVEWESLDVLVTDGGEVSPADIAEAGGFHQDSVYRALDRMDELVEREYGSVSLKSTHVAELVHESVQAAKQRTREAVEAAGKAMQAADRGLDERTSAFVAFASQHFERFEETDDGLQINFGKVEADTHQAARREIKQKLREGKRLWDSMNRDEMKWRLGKWQARIERDKYADMNTLSETVVESHGGPLHALD
jgi:hypothetical protein